MQMHLKSCINTQFCKLFFLPLPAKCMSLVCYYVSLVCVSAVGCVFDLSEPVCFGTVLLSSG